MFLPTRHAAQRQTRSHPRAPREDERLVVLHQKTPLVSSTGSCAGPASAPEHGIAATIDSGSMSGRAQAGHERWRHH